MTVDEVMKELRQRGSAQTKKTFLRHGAREPFYGVKVADLKVIQKRIKQDHELALALYDTGNSDAMYLAGLVAEPAKMTKAHLERWVKAAYWHMIGEYTVAWVASESPHGWELGRKWIDAKAEGVAAAGWATLGSLTSVTPDADLDLDGLAGLLNQVPKRMGTAANRVKYTMNGFVIAVGCFVAPLAALAKSTAKALGTVAVDMGDTDCKVPVALQYIEKVEAAGRAGKKRKSARC